MGSAVKMPKTQLTQWESVVHPAPPNMADNGTKVTVEKLPGKRNKIPLTNEAKTEGER